MNFTLNFLQRYYGILLFKRLQGLINLILHAYDTTFNIANI